LLEDLNPGATAHLNLLADEWSEPEPVVVTDAQGRALPLMRSQAAQIRRAHKHKQNQARIWLSGGLEITATGHMQGNFAARPNVVAHPALASKKPRPAQQKRAGRGAKPSKSD